MESLKPLLRTTRPSFLVLAPACVLLGLGTAIHTGAQVSLLHFVLVLVGAVSAHVSVDVFNEYFDFRSGLDSRTVRTPFSGGSGALQEHPELAGKALALGWLTLGLTALIGFYFLAVRGPALLPLGLFGLVIIFVYTPGVAYNPWLNLVTPGLGFGTLMVLGTDFALSGSYSYTAFAASMVPFFLVNNLLLLNQFPDVDADRSVGKKHFPILIGRSKSSLIYGLFLLLTYLSIVVSVLVGLFPATALLGLLTVALAIPAFRGAYTYADDIPRLVPALGMNVAINIATPVLLGIGLML